MFKYHPDNVILHNGNVIRFDDFIAANSTFPITEGDFFEYNNGKLEVIRNGNHYEVKNENLITAINNLGE